MFENNKIVKVVWGLTPSNPFVTSIEADCVLMRIVNTRAKYMQVQVIEFVRFEKVVFLHFSRNATKCIAVGCSNDGQSAWLVSSDSREQ